MELSKLGVAENWVMISPLLHFYLPCLISCPSSREEQEGFVLKRWIRHEREESVGSILGWPIKSSRRVIFFVLWISENLTVCGKMRGWGETFLISEIFIKIGSLVITKVLGFNQTQSRLFEFQSFSNKYDCLLLNHFKKTLLKNDIKMHIIKPYQDNYMGEGPTLRGCQLEGL